ncbi:MAG TPA: hypothetical protein VGP85_17180 [Pyrinomonadaceae bacterium]|nr:hypothetical protein [Pyrinomonadaceae bacterium]
MYGFISACIVLSVESQGKRQHLELQTTGTLVVINKLANQLTGKVPVEAFTIEQGEETKMPDDKMKNQQGREDQGHGQQSPGRNPQDDKSSTGQRSGGGMNKEPMHDKGTGGGQKGSQGQGSSGQKR